MHTKSHSEGGQLETVLSPSQASPVLCVDMDGALLSTDLIWENIISLLKTSPLAMFRIPFWMLQGRASCERKLGQFGVLDPALIPCNQDLLCFLTAEREKGRHVVLVTGDETERAQRLAEYLGSFGCLVAKSQGRKLNAEKKAELLSRTFADTGFDFVGSSPADAPIWKFAVASYFCGDRETARNISSNTQLERVFVRNGATLSSWYRAIRGDHWAKNVLLFLPLLLAHRFQVGPLIATALGFALFSLGASSIYIVNDLLDLHSDRTHAWKRKRPFASGETRIPTGLSVAAVLLVATVTGAFWLKQSFGGVLLFYLACAFLYSLRLKRLVLLDVFILSGFYSLRIWAGSLITATPLSDWFLCFSLFFFLSLAMAKRHSELVYSETNAGNHNSGRGYSASDNQLLMHIGIGSSFSAVVIFVLYAHSKDVLSLYPHPEILLLIGPAILYWLSRMWLKSSRGELDEDPVTLSVRDPVSYFVAAFILVLLVLSSLQGTIRWAP